MALWALWLPALAAPMQMSAATGSVRFEARSSLHDFQGEAGVFEGDFDPEALTGALTVRAAGIGTGLGARDERLRLTCLETDRFPEIRYDLRHVHGDTALLQRGEGSGALTFEGLLQIRDQVVPVVIPARFTWEEAGLRLLGAIPLRWGDFGIPDPSILISVMAPEITVRFDVVARAVAAP